jgi:hypothetical protein
MTFDLCDWFIPLSYPFMQRRLIASWLQADIADPGVRRTYHVASRRPWPIAVLPRITAAACPSA